MCIAVHYADFNRKKCNFIETMIYILLVDSLIWLTKNFYFEHSLDDIFIDITNLDVFDFN